MSVIQLDGRLFQRGSEALRALLPQAHAAQARPLCMCLGPDRGGVAMYVARAGDGFVVKRMPNTGRDHAPDCEVYEPPPELSGLGAVVGGAIKEDPQSGQTVLRLDFSMRRLGGRSAPPAGGEPGGAVAGEESKLTLRALLHHLWEEAQLNRWSPAMEGKRTWFVVQRELQAVVGHTKTARGALSDQVYIPESFKAERADEIAARREAHLAPAKAAGTGARSLMLLLAEVKEIVPSRYGFKIVAKQVPDRHFMMDGGFHKRLAKRFEHELALWGAHDDLRLIVLGTFSLGDTGVARVEEVTLMLANQHWVPLDNASELDLLRRLGGQARRYTKGLRYNLSQRTPLASAVLTDTAEPTALYLVPPGAPEGYEAALASLVEESKLQAWIWHPADKAMPDLPPKQPWRGADVTGTVEGDLT